MLLLYYNIILYNNYIIDSNNHGVNSINKSTVVAKSNNGSDEIKAQEMLEKYIIDKQNNMSGRPVCSRLLLTMILMVILPKLSMKFLYK